MKHFSVSLGVPIEDFARHKMIYVAVDLQQIMLGGAKGGVCLQSVDIAIFAVLEESVNNSTAI